MAGADLTEIANRIREMGYITVELKDALKPSFYKLKDGTLLEVTISVSHIIPDPKSPSGYSISATTAITSYVPTENRHPERFVLFDPSSLLSGIVDQDMEPETLVEEFNSYSMSNGMTMSVKSVVAQVRKTKFYTMQGEPFYLVDATPITKVTTDG